MNVDKQIEETENSHGSISNNIKKRDQNIGNCINNKYIIKKKICEGSLGKVYLAEEIINPSMNSIVVIKIIQKRIGKTEHKIERDREIPKILNHRNIIKIIDFYENDVNAYLIYPSLENSICLTKIGVKKLNFKNKENLREMIDILLQICGAVEYMHSNNVIHRDIKPENIIISGSLAFLTDFDLACILNSTEYPLRAGIIGTPNYMAPEIWKKEDHINYFMSDIYSLGVTFYFLFNKKKFPYRCKTIEELEFMIRYENPKKSNSGIEKMDSLIMNMMCKNPVIRPHITNIRSTLTYINNK